ncbi:hypothetical protein ACQRV2_10495, partial [Clostridioides difficile]
SSQIAMNAVASSQIAMNAVASSQIAMNAVASSQIAVNTIINNSGFLNIVISSSTAMLAISKSRVNLQAFNKAIWDNRLDSKMETTLLNSSSFTRTFNYQSDSWIKSNTGTNVGAYSQGDIITKPNKIFILKYTTNSDNGTITINADGFTQTGTDGNGSGSPGTFPGIVSHYDVELTCYRRVYFGKVNVQISTTSDYYYGDIFTAK